MYLKALLLMHRLQAELSPKREIKIMPTKLMARLRIRTDTIGAARLVIAAKYFFCIKFPI
jgi:hypothetical protein